jgi:hypothetical protein
LPSFVDYSPEVAVKNCDELRRTKNHSKGENHES